MSKSLVEVLCKALTSPFATPQKNVGNLAMRDTEFMFRRARRHSRRVHILRVTIPVLLFVGTIVTTLIVYYNPKRTLEGLSGSISRVTLAGTKVVMLDPKTAGYTRDGRPFKLNALSAVQDVLKIDVVNFEEPRATLVMGDGSTINVRAATGTFDRKSNILTMHRNIVVTSTSGYEAHLSQAVVNVSNGSLVSDEPVEVTSQQGTLLGNRLEVINSGDIIRFDSGVTMIVMPDGIQDPPNDGDPKVRQ